MDRNHIIGFVLILLVMLGWSELYLKPQMDEQARQKKTQDSLLVAEKKKAEEQVQIVPKDTSVQNNLVPSAKPDSISLATPMQVEKKYTLKNSLVEINFTNKGGSIHSAKLLKYHKIKTDSLHQEYKVDLFLLNDPKNKFEYIFKTSQGDVKSSDLFFEVTENSDSKITFKAQSPKGGIFIQDYELSGDDYKLQYNLRTEGMNLTDNVQIYWENHLERIEKNTTYEQSYSSAYYKESTENATYCSCTSSDLAEGKKNLEWVSHSNQFFNSALIPSTPFASGNIETVMLQENSDEMKTLKSTLNFPSSQVNNNTMSMHWYIGPNEFNRLKSFNKELEDVISYGWSFFGTINKYLIRPLFSFLAGLMGSKGIIILLMTLIVKLFVFPLSYKMLQSQAKMMALKPEIDKVKVKHKDDMQQQQVETMKMYNEFGVNPLGGCLPLLLQTPIWIALYRFFPATIEFRQESFLWATDLTSYDEFLHLPFNIPFFGDTISLFAFLWVVSTIIFTYFNSKSQDFSANPAMLYMQYLMPLIFWFMFNKTAAGLTAYMFFSNLLNIGQTLAGRSFLFNTEKIRAQLELNKTKPKKKGGFRSKMEEMIKERQKIEQEKLKNPKKK
ncbi:MAG: membrane protein insertase YidC [Saprospiraceae bacterium]|nr:membrane protein insertase YidC [Saprospiraceae bacterium]